MAATDIVINFLGNAQGLINAANQGSGGVQRFSDRTRKAAKLGLAGVAAFGAGLVSTMKSGVEGLMEGAEAEARLTDAMSRAPKKIQASTDAIKANAEAIQLKTKFTYEDALAASTFLVAQDGASKAIQHGVTTSKELQRVSLDLATVMKTDATGGAKLLAKALAAPEKASALLRKAGVNLTASEAAQVKAWGKSGETAKAQALIMDKLKAKTEGAAEAAGDTMSGKLERAKNAFGEMQESLATGLIPVLESLSEWGLKISGWLQDNPAKVKVAVIVLGGLALAVGLVSTAISVWSTVTKVATGIQAAFNLVMAMNPITLVIIAIAALVIGMEIAYKKSETFRTVVNAAFQAVKVFVIDALKVMFNTIMGFWGMIIDGAAKAFGWVPGIGDKLKGAQRAFHTFKDDVNATLDGIRDKNVTVTVQMLKKDWDNRAIDSAGKTVYGPSIPARAMGGAVAARRTYLVGERGPELFTPRGSGQITPNHELAAASASPDVLHLTLDLGHGIHQVVQINLKDQARATKRTVNAGGRRTV